MQLLNISIDKTFSLLAKKKILPTRSTIAQAESNERDVITLLFRGFVTGLIGQIDIQIKYR